MGGGGLAGKYSGRYTDGARCEECGDGVLDVYDFFCCVSHSSFYSGVAHYLALQRLTKHSLDKTNLGPSPNEMYKFGVGLNRQCPSISSPTPTSTSTTATSTDSAMPTETATPPVCAHLTLDDETLEGYTPFIPPFIIPTYYPTTKFFDKAFVSTAYFLKETNAETPNAEGMAILCAIGCDDINAGFAAGIVTEECYFSYAFSGTSYLCIPSLRSSRSSPHVGTEKTGEG